MTHPMSDVEARWLSTVFPFAFAGGWLAISTLLGVMSGWFTLQSAYARGEDPALLTLRGKSGSMGFGVGLNGILTLSACATGLRVGIWRMFGPFQRPFLVPWSDIRAEPRQMLFVPSTKLRFGAPEIGTLTIDTASWQRLAAFATGRAAATLATERVTRRQTGRGLLLQWLLIAGGAGTFFTVASRTMAGTAMAPPILVCYALPAVMFGIPQLIRWLRFGR